MTREKDIDLAIEAGATHIGLILAPGSPRCLSADRAAALRKYVGTRAAAVGVFRKQPLDEVRALVSSCELSWVQLHGGFVTADATTLREEGLRVIWAAPVHPDGKWNDPQVKCDFLLLDTQKASGFGGTGIAFRWKNTPRPNVPFFLAGGIGNQNAVEAFSTMRPDGLDFNSALEDAPGEKSSDALIELKTTLSDIRKLTEHHTVDL